MVVRYREEAWSYSRIVLVGFLCVGLLYCSSQGEAGTKQASEARRRKMSEAIRLTEANQGTTTALAEGGVIMLALEETPSTGYRWSTESSPVGMMEVLETRWVAPTGSAVGGAGTREIVLKAKSTGVIRLRLKLWREWQGEASVMRRCEFTFNVH
jgi:inhibitor of cysteine peptidase